MTHAAPQAPRPPGAATRPHVVLVICDQMQYQRQGVVDPLAFTPNLDAFARENVQFSHCYASNPQCVPSRASLQTGLYPHESEVMINYGLFGHTGHLSEARHVTVGHVFRDAGYTTAYFGKTHFGRPMEALGYDHGVERIASAPLSAVDVVITNEAIEFLRDHPAHEPLFLTVSWHEPHPPFELIQDFAGRYPRQSISLPESFYRADFKHKPAFQQRPEDGPHVVSDESAAIDELRRYYTMISHVDRMFGDLRRCLQDRGIWDDAVVIFTSDHGDMMAAHRMRLKGTLPYEEILRVPLIVRIPQVRRSRTIVDDLVVNTSIPGTMIQAAGLELPKSFKGGSLVPAMASTVAGSDQAVYFEHYGAYWGIHPLRGIRTPRWKYVWYYGPDQAEELYDLKADPTEVKNFAQSSAHADVKEWLADKLEAWWRSTGGREFDYYESDGFRTWGSADLVLDTDMSARSMTAWQAGSASGDDQDADPRQATD